MMKYPMAMLVPTEIEYRMKLIGLTTFVKVLNQTSDQAQSLLHALTSIFTSIPNPVDVLDLPHVKDAADTVLYGLDTGYSMLPMFIMLSAAFTLGIVTIFYVDIYLLIFRPDVAGSTVQ